MSKAKWTTRRSYEQALEAAKVPIKITSVECPVCGAKRGTRCTFPDTRRKRKRPHPERRAAVRAKRAAWERRTRRMRLRQTERWSTVRISYDCPICHSDHSRADHIHATNTLLQRAQHSPR